MEWDKIYNCDCINGMKKIDNNSADIIIADPPYNIGKDFGNNKDNLSLRDYLLWTKKWLAECFRIIKPAGTIYIYGFSEILAHISCLIDIDKQKWLVWHYTNKNVPSLDFWQRSHESIISCWKGKNPIFNRDDIREPYTETFLRHSAGKIRTGTLCRFNRNGKKTIYNAHEKGALPRDVIKVSTLAGGASLKERIIYCENCKTIIDAKQRSKHKNHTLLIHPTQKPYEVSDKLIKAARPDQDSFNVLIPFSGSGSECISTIRNGGHFIGFEINPKYCLLAEKAIIHELEPNTPKTSLKDWKDSTPSLFDYCYKVLQG